MRAMVRTPGRGWARERGAEGALHPLAVRPPAGGGGLRERGRDLLLAQQPIRARAPALVMAGERGGDLARLRGRRRAAGGGDLRRGPLVDRPREAVLRADPADHRLQADTRALRDGRERDLVPRPLEEEV